MTNTSCCEYSFKTPDDRQQESPKHVDLCIKIKLRNNASCWFLLYEYFTMHGPQNIKKPTVILIKIKLLLLCALLLTVVGLLCIVLLSCVYSYFLLPHVYCFYYLCIAVLHTLVAGLLARSQYAEGSATGHLDTGSSWFPCVYKRMLK